MSIFVLLRAGAIALELTGLPKAAANFQALSALTGTGFTTREAESVVAHPLRRRIVSFLMILGNVGIVTIISTFVVSLQTGGLFRPSLNLVILIVGLLVLYRLASHRRFGGRLSVRIRRKLREKLPLETGVPVEELIHQGMGYGISRLLVSQNSPCRGKTLAESGFRGQDVIVLSIERDGTFIPAPKAQERLEPGDLLLCYGRTASLERIIEGQ